MNQLFRKEIREQAKVAALAVAILTFILLQVFQSCCSELATVASGQGMMDMDLIQPLMSEALHSELGLFCAIYGLALGWLQIRAEKHRDLRAFLIHRPICRTTILWNKVAAGCLLYTITTALPLLGFVMYDKTPGHVAAPFEWAMTLPLVAIFLVGILFYFAGMLTALRTARWFGSRAFGIGLAILIGTYVYNSPEFWMALMELGIGIAALVMAVRGSFSTGGTYGEQSPVEKTALALVCMGAAIFLMMTARDGSFLIFESASDSSNAEYVMGMDGAIYKAVQSGFERQYFDLNGKLLLDPNSGKPMKAREFDMRRAPMKSINPFFDRVWRNPTAETGYMNAGRFFAPWQLTDKIYWFYTRDGAVSGYNGMSRRHVTTLRAADGASSRFLLSEVEFGGFNAYELERFKVLVSPKSVYRVNFDNYSLEPIFTATNGDLIGGYAEGYHFVFTNNIPDVAVIGRSNIRLINLDGKIQWSEPYQPAFPQYSQVAVTALNYPGKYALQFDPNGRSNELANWKLPVHYEWITTEKGISKTMDLPFLRTPWHENIWEKRAAELQPPVSLIFDVRRDLDFLTLMPAFIAATVGWFLGRRYHFPARAQSGWFVFNLLFGCSGLLAFLAVQEWPARERCPSCRSARPVDHAKCPHCGADFAPPEPTGTEIFESLQTVARE